MLCNTVALALQFVLLQKPFIQSRYALRPACSAADHTHRIAGRCLKWLRELPCLTLWRLQSAERKKCYSSALTHLSRQVRVPVSACVVKKSLHLIVKAQSICLKCHTKIVCGQFIRLSHVTSCSDSQTNRFMYIIPQNPPPVCNRRVISALYRLFSCFRSLWIRRAYLCRGVLSYTVFYNGFDDIGYIPDLVFAYNGGFCFLLICLFHSRKSPFRGIEREYKLKRQNGRLLVATSREFHPGPCLWVRRTML